MPAATSIPATHIYRYHNHYYQQTRDQTAFESAALRRCPSLSTPFPPCHPVVISIAAAPGRQGYHRLLARHTLIGLGQHTVGLVSLLAPPTLSGLSHTPLFPASRSIIRRLAPIPFLLLLSGGRCCRSSPPCPGVAARLPSPISRYRSSVPRYTPPSGV